MQLFNKTFDDPRNNLEIDEKLLKLVDKGHFTEGILRIWESKTYFVVLGLSKKIKDDVNELNCIKDNVPILKRCSGGGTVLQGPGCFNYGYILPISHTPQLNSIHQTTDYILQKVKGALTPTINNIQLQGVSDLTVNNIKFSGNAQRRLKNAVLFHGTILYDFDLSLVAKYLKEPPIQPDYRLNRPHKDFINNAPIKKQELIETFKKNTTGDLKELDISS
jgi:lipoate-protein ligase A